MQQTRRRHTSSRRTDAAPARGRIALALLLLLAGGRSAAGETEVPGRLARVGSLEVSADPHGACRTAHPSAPAPRSPLRSGETRLPDGTRLHYVEQGPSTGPTLVLLHGWTDSWFSFSLLLPRIPERYRVIVPDQRGHGCSDRPEGGYGMDQLAADALALMDALGVERATLAGHSMGSLVAQHAAAIAPDRVDGLVLIGSGVDGRVPALLELEPLIAELPDPVPLDFVREFQASTAQRPLPPEFLDGVVAESLKLPARVWAAALHGLLTTPPAPVPEDARAPVLVLWGDRDGIFGRADQDALLRARPRARHIELPGTGHAPHWEQPQTVMRELIAFLAMAGHGA